MFRLAAPLWLCCLVASQTYVVDALGGGSFTDLPQAIAAVPNGAVLRVRPGSYSPFTIANKGLVILGDGASSVTVSMQSADVQIGPTAANQRVIVRDVAFLSGPSPTVYSFRCKEALGPVLLENVKFGMNLSLDSLYLTVSASSNVHFLGCDLAWLGVTIEQHKARPARLAIDGSRVEISRTRVRGHGVAGAGGGSASDAVSASRGSWLMVADCSLLGGEGGWSSSGSTTATPGGCGLLLASGSVAHVYGAQSVIQGGRGGTSFFMPSVYPAARGGDGIVVGDSEARILGVQPIGGLGGVGTPPGASGLGVVASGSATYKLDLRPTRLAASVTGTQAPGQIVQLALQSYPSGVAALVLGTSLELDFGFPVTLGGRCVDLGFVLGPIALPSSGEVQVPLALPNAGFLDYYLLGQWFTLDPLRNELVASNAITVLLKS